MQDYTNYKTLRGLKTALTKDGYIEYTTAWARGYYSRKKEIGLVEPYKGRYGVGYVVHTPSDISSQYHKIAYWISK
jgi:hypothetical protein